MDEDKVQVEAKKEESQDTVKDATVDYEKEASSYEDKALKFLMKQTNEVVVPSFSRWFQMEEVHAIEKRSLPEFFDNSSRFKSEKSYMDTRNFMINTYRLSPSEYLTITAVRRNIALDIASIVKIHEFLEKWGLINYQVDPRSKPTVIGPSFTGHFQIVLDTPQGLKPFLPEKTKKINKKRRLETAIELENENYLKINMREFEDSILHANEDSKSNDKGLGDDKYPINVSLRKNIYDPTNAYNALKSEKLQSKDMQKVFICHMCGNNNITVKYFNLRNRHANLCTKCFSREQFGEKFQSSDFLKLSDENSFPHRKIWSDQDIVLLLEGLEMFQSDWGHIARHVGGNKTVEDCIDKYLSLPLQDRDVKYLMDKYRAKEPTSNVSNVINIMEETITQLLDSQNKEIIEEKLLISAKICAEKYEVQMRVLAQELIKQYSKKLKIKLERLNNLNIALVHENERYSQEIMRITDDKSRLSQDVASINNKLSELNVTKKLVIASEQMDSNMDMLEKEEQDSEKREQDDNSKDLDQNKNNSTFVEPQVFKVWSL
ncbi:Chromatin structure-remodeling complex protein RSC8 [Nakaseomyces bracarensis]|uniref:Chromatin structure-remodeling complex protein RSC8 n=1 Tax=Nakaseomyces bracarensis TaxID=273131 RepID=A0ABR4NW38_9SACH